jgi:hypothetical protein
VYLMTTGSQLTNPKKGFMVCMWGWIVVC